MVDAIDSLAISIFHSPGVYAVFLGSGVSRPAGIPTGAEITEKLIQEIAAVTGEKWVPDPKAWYVEKYKEEPDYSNVMEEVVRSQPERSQLLRPYFELTPREREEGITGLKVPTEAHNRLANLISDGYIRVVLTTNFDPLLEKALDALNVKYQIISTVDDINGVLPLAHADCTIIKINGDYRDARIRNTVAELTKYEEPLERLLDRVLDEYGLIVCGWSADTDIGIRNAFMRCPTQRFKTYWTIREKPRDTARSIIQERCAQTINITSADMFFTQLEEKITALKDLDIERPPTARMASAIVKRYLPEEKHAIRLHDFVIEQAEVLRQLISDEHFPVNNPQPTKEELVSRVERYESLSAVPIAIMATGCYWGKQEHQAIWVKSIERVAEPSLEFGGITTWLYLRHYPALLVLYAAGIAAVASDQHSTLRSLLLEPQIRSAQASSTERPCVLALNTTTVMDLNVARLLFDQEQRYTPVSDRLFQCLREPLRELIPQESRYERYFDRFEYLLALAYAHLNFHQSNHVWGPIGRFAWRQRYLTADQHIFGEIDREIEAMAEGWPPFRSGLFGNSLDNLRDIKRNLDQQITQRNWY